jgi:hypothetical protein
MLLIGPGHKCGAACCYQQPHSRPFSAIFDLAISFYFMSLSLLNCMLVKLIFIFYSPTRYHHYGKHIDVDFPAHLPAAKRSHGNKEDPRK